MPETMLIFLLKLYSHISPERPHNVTSWLCKFSPLQLVIKYEIPGDTKHGSKIYIQGIQCKCDKGTKIHWLPHSRENFEFKLVSLVFKCLHEEAPPYLKVLITIKIVEINTRSASTITLDIPLVKQYTSVAICWCMWPQTMEQLTWTFAQNNIVRKDIAYYNTHMINCGLHHTCTISKFIE